MYKQQVVHCSRFVVLVCQWYIVGVFVNDMLLCTVHVLPCVLFVTCMYMCVYELNHILVILPLELGWNPQISRVCVCVCTRMCTCVKEKEIRIHVWRFLIYTHDLKYYFM